MSAIRIVRAGPLVTIQDAGRFGALRYGISASGPMDRGAFARAGRLLESAGTAGLEFTRAGLGFSLEAGAAVMAAFAGGDFVLRVNGQDRLWASAVRLEPGDAVDISPGASGNYGYLRFDHEVNVPPVLGSRATNLVAGLGGVAGRALVAGDVITLAAADPAAVEAGVGEPAEGPVRVVWGLHADGFDRGTRDYFTTADFSVSSSLDRMGVRLNAPGPGFAGMAGLSLVSDAIVPGDIQILGDCTPIVLMRDHQPTGGYPRIATVIGADLDRFAQLRPGATVRFEPVTPDRARRLLRRN